MHRSGDNSFRHRRRGSNASSSTRRSHPFRRQHHGSHSSAQPLVNGTAHDSNPSFNVRSLSDHHFFLPMTTGGRAVTTATTASDSGVGDPSTMPRPLVTPGPIVEEQLSLPTHPVDRGPNGNSARDTAPTAPGGTSTSVVDIDLGGLPGHLAEATPPEYSGGDVVGAYLAGTGAHFDEQGLPPY